MFPEEKVLECHRADFHRKRKQRDSTWGKDSEVRIPSSFLQLLEVSRQKRWDYEGKYKFVCLFV